MPLREPSLDLRDRPSHAARAQLNRFRELTTPPHAPDRRQRQPDGAGDLARRDVTGEAFYIYRNDRHAKDFSMSTRTVARLVSLFQFLDVSANGFTADAKPPRN